MPAKNKTIAKEYGIKPKEIKLYAQNFEHKDIENAKKMIKKYSKIWQQNAPI